jgi:ABC-type lipoprotein release transport system permease subunit
MVLLGGFRVVVAGMVVGLVLAWLLAQSAAAVLYGVSPKDLGTFAGVAGLVLLVAAAASWNPAARAMRVDPARTLRGD